MPRASTEVSPAKLEDVWNDPGFRRSFVGGYGISPDVEPRISQDDLALLELVRQLMPDDLASAEALLRDTIRPEACAVFDLTLGGIQFQQEKLEPALENYRTAVSKFPNFRRAYRSIGLICTRRNQYDDAIAAFNKMIELGSADAYSYGLLGFCHSQKQDFQPAEAAYRNALLLQPENVEWRLGLTRSVFKQGKYEDAASLLDVLVSAFPDKADFWLLQAHTYLGLKEPMKAAVNLEALDSIGKASADSLFTLGDIYLAESLPDLAVGAFDRAVSRFPQQAPARAVRSAEMLASRGGAWAQCTLPGPARGYTNMAFDVHRDRFVMPGGIGPTPAGRQWIPDTYELAMGCAGDLNGDGRVSGADLSVVLCNWGTSVPGTTGDVNADGTVNGEDLSVLVAAWGDCS